MRNPPVRRSSLLLRTLAGLFLTLPATVAGAAIDLKPCELPGLDLPARCGTYEVYENRAAASGRKIALRVAVLPATGSDPLPDPIFFFAGGPGGSAVEMASFVAYLNSALTDQRDIVLVDVRGTGESNPLECDYQAEGDQRGAREVLESFIPTDKLPECRRKLSETSDLTQYNTPTMIDDVNEVRAALGYAQINVMGGSYGSTSALVYLRRHPDTVRTVIIEGIAPLGTKAPLTFARDAQRAFDGVARECAEDAACHAAFPDPAGDLRKILERLRNGSVTVEVVDPESGSEQTLEVTTNVFIQTLRYMLYNSLEALQVPAYLQATAAGDFKAIGQSAYSSALALLSGIPDGLYLSVTCTEDVADIDPAEIADATAGTFLGDFRIHQQRAACAEWVRTDLPDGFNEQVHSKKPVLIISGERDPVTPAEWGDLVAKTLPNSRHLVVSDAAHGHFGLRNVECVSELIAELVRSGSVNGLDVEGCEAAIERPAFLLSVQEEETIAMAKAQKERLVGHYAIDEGMSAQVLMAEEGLLVKAFGEEMVILPVGPMRFKIKGSAPGSALVFHEKNGKIVALEFLKGGSSLLEFQRQESSQE